MKPNRILLIEDHQIYRETVGKTLESKDGHECVGQFSTLEDSFEAITKGLEADIILLDLGLPTMDGIAGIGRLRELLPEAKVIILTAFTDRNRVFAALEAGAHGYLVKAGSARRLLESLDEVVDGGTPLDPQIAGMVLSTFQKLSPITEEEKLAPREREILQFVAKGLTKQQVAEELKISPHSVSGYLRRAFEKLHVHSLPAAVSAAIRRGLLDFS